MDAIFVIINLPIIISTHSGTVVITLKPVNDDKHKLNYIIIKFLYNEFKNKH